MPTLEKQEEFLEACVRDYDHILIDTCSLMSTGAHAFWQHVLPITRRYGKKIIVPLTVWKELENNSKDLRKDATTRKEAYNALMEITHLQNVGDIQIVGTDQEKNALAHPELADKKKAFADNVFLMVLTVWRMKYDTLTITQDRGLTADILALGQSSNAVRVPKKVHVRALTADGYLRQANRMPGASGVSSAQRPRFPQQRSEPANAGTGEPFAKTTRLQVYPGMMAFQHRPETGAMLSALYSDGRRETLRLGAEIAHGGEGGVYSTNQSGLVAKIYRPEKLTRMKFEKLKRMVAHNIECRGVCFPKALIYNMENEFCGYLMAEAKGKPLQASVFSLWKKGAANPFPTWTKLDTVQLCITILEKIIFLHRMNIILGDINPGNILVVSPTEVYFVDTDSYQVEGFPCPVGMINFTPREILMQGEKLHYDTFLRTEGNENFAIATLLFMIMLPGKPPYSMVGGESQRENIISGDFSYPCGDKSTGKVPQGRWRYCWSQLPYKAMKETFYQTFRLGEPHSTEATRYSAEGWLSNFQAYRKLLKNGNLLENDDQALMIFPTHFKKQAGVTYAKCQLCGREFEERRLSRGYCHECSEKTYRTLICADCGRTFAFTYGEKAFYDERGMTLPKRCEACRKARDAGGHHSSLRAGSLHRSAPRPVQRSHQPQPRPQPRQQPRVDSPQETAKPQGFWDHLFNFFR